MLISLSPQFFPISKVFEMATKRKFAAENSGALVPVKKPKQNQLALQDQGGAIQSVWVNIFPVCVLLWRHNCLHVVELCYAMLSNTQHYFNCWLYL